MVSYEYFWDRYYLKLRILKNETYTMLEETYKIENKQPEATDQRNGRESDLCR